MFIYDDFANNIKDSRIKHTLTTAVYIEYTQYYRILNNNSVFVVCFATQNWKKKREERETTTTAHTESSENRIGMDTAQRRNIQLQTDTQIHAPATYLRRTYSFSEILTQCPVCVCVCLCGIVSYRIYCPFNIPREVNYIVKLLSRKCWFVVVLSAEYANVYVFVILHDSLCVSVCLSASIVCHYLYCFSKQNKTE